MREECWTPLLCGGGKLGIIRTLKYGKQTQQSPESVAKWPNISILDCSNSCSRCLDYIRIVCGCAAFNEYKLWIFGVVCERNEIEKPELIIREWETWKCGNCSSDSIGIQSRKSKNPLHIIHTATINRQRQMCNNRCFVKAEWKLWSSSMRFHVYDDWICW